MQERQLVTIALIAFNQESFIREAVEGVLSQSYSPLQVILSDDCSTDKTFDIIDDIANNYNGPHRLKLIRNEKNLGICGHINNVLSQSEGDWIFIAAGDDISSSERVSEVMRLVMSDSSIKLVQTHLAIIDEQGLNIGTNSLGGSVQTSLNNTYTKWGLKDRLSGRSLNTHGACFSYSRSLMSLFGPLPEGCIYEDNILNWRAELIGNVALLHKQLVSYRTHRHQITHSGLPSGLRKYDQKRINHISDGVATTRQNIMDLEQAVVLGLIDEQSRNLANHWLQKRLKYFELRKAAIVAWWPLRLIQLIRLLLMGRGYSPLSRDNILRSLLPTRFYYALKSQ